MKRLKIYADFRTILLKVMGVTTIIIVIVFLLLVFSMTKNIKSPVIEDDTDYNVSTAVYYNGSDTLLHVTTNIGDTTFVNCYKKRNLTWEKMY